MRDTNGGEAEFARKIDADRAILHFIQGRLRRDEWLLRLDVHHLESNLCFHLHRDILKDGSSKHYAWLLPIDFDVPPAEWKLLADDGSEMTVGMTVTFVRGNEETTLLALKPPHKMASGGKVIVASGGGGSRRYGASVFGGTFKYLPPETALTAAGLLWASTAWQPADPFDVPPPRTLVLPPHWTTVLGAVSDDF
ncbi:MULTISPECIES: hypothetical protein [Bradyrhizobium]|uniref:Uncharacterized protein n=1 Tax=Bradyrhizobium canariense TaxID=255045 RepID=A0A1X3H9T5_9BRAD|nr:MULTISPECIES: hypothetical protein [Bradyrhizobium]OSI71601.1 hypothetical protein BSZ22_10940 [Bradyrhizobium canariense]OSI80564.1 hypothetical protein BSZ23_10660 [Bradyrhizobium canariense]OSI91166.1 hypothetical protein BSZ25_16225 [Bradyrhizobium canariense]OSI96237.1 hypothetical protein BSZ24_05035 [Bradyrhizobium canariense]OSJ09217.1 hypothetical protein BSZ16_06855 [Bradyrhizobium canariense]